MPPSAAARTESVWSHLMGVDFMFNSEESDSVSAEAVESCLPQNCGHY